MGRGRSEPVETSRGSHRCFASIFHSWILRRFLRVSPSSSGAWARGVRGPPCRCLQARRPHAHVACPAVPVAALPVPGVGGQGRWGARATSPPWGLAGRLGRGPHPTACFTPTRAVRLASQPRRCAVGACCVAAGDATGTRGGDRQLLCWDSLGGDAGSSAEGRADEQGRRAGPSL